MLFMPVMAHFKMDIKWIFSVSELCCFCSNYFQSNFSANILFILTSEIIVF